MVGLGEQDDVSRFHIHDFHPARVNAQLSGEILPRVSREGVWIGETAILTRDGREIPVLMVSIAHLSADGKLDVFSTISRDISDRKRWEQELEQARDAAEEASRAKSEFLANMSHEIRTPMNGVLGMTALVLETELTAQQRQYLEVVRESGESLLQLLNDILDFSKIEAGHLDFHEVDFSLAEILGRVVRAFALPAHQKGLQLTCDVAPGTVDRLVGDPERLRQVLFNLVSNAIKFTPRGEVALRARVETLTDDALVLHVAVQDTGIGIKPELQQVIFEPFRQADSSTTRRYGGTGLGLTICTRLIERMGGRIWLESAVGQGSTFHVTARLRRSRTWPAAEDRQRPAQAAGEAKGREGPRLHVLLVEDNPINQRVALHMLEDLGHAVTVAANGREALEVQARERFDLALMDVQMPGMDGFEVTAAIRDREKQTGLHLPILALTAHVMDGDRELCLASGMDGYLAKPIQPEEFRRALANLPGGRRTACHSGPPGSAVRPALDQAALLARVGNPQRLGRLVEIFRDSCPAMLQAVRDALGRADATGLSRAVHALKGSLGSLSATAAFEAAQKLEEMGKSGDLSHAAGALAVLEQEVDRFQAELAKLIQEERP
jgi:signal transduction histidine kinase/HPt (histidine-containing phosphotransfer) domain-containing protein/ActR/RegA family two-component response regulator